MESGARYGHYEILALRGKGGMGEVWRRKTPGSGSQWRPEAPLHDVLQ